MKQSSKRITGWTAAALGVVGVGAAVIQAYGSLIDIRSKAKDAREKSVAGYETLNPAVQELQDIALDEARWAESTDEEIQGLRDRLSWIEGYVRAKHSATTSRVRPRSIPMAPSASSIASSVATREVKKRAETPKKFTPVNIDIAQKTLYENTVVNTSGE